MSLDEQETEILRELDALGARALAEKLVAVRRRAGRREKREPTPDRELKALFDELRNRDLIEFDDGRRFTIESFAQSSVDGGAADFIWAHQDGEAAARHMSLEEFVSGRGRIVGRRVEIPPEEESDDDSDRQCDGCGHPLRFGLSVVAYVGEFVYCQECGEERGIAFPPSPPPLEHVPD